MTKLEKLNLASQFALNKALKEKDEKRYEYKPTLMDKINPDIEISETASITPLGIIVLGTLILGLLSIIIDIIS